MCGITGIVCKLEKEFKDFDSGKFTLLSEQINSIEVKPENLEKLEIFLDEAEPFVDELFAFSNFYQIYVSENKKSRVELFLELLENFKEELEVYINATGVSVSLDIIERFNSLLIRMKDITWRIREDLLENFAKIRDLASAFPRNEKRAFIYQLWKLNFIFNNLDRLEVRGRDSAGMSCIVKFCSPEDMRNFKEGLDEELRVQYEKRIAFNDFVNYTIIESKNISSGKPDSLVFTFKVAEEIGKMGDNVFKLKNSIRSDGIFLKAISSENIETGFFAHTRWASNGIINEQNCHPVNNETISLSTGEGGVNNYCISAVLNGDIDNFQELKEECKEKTGRRISGNITTDAKIIPVVIEKYYEEKKNLLDAFRFALNDFKGSMAIVFHSSLEPGKVYLALRGSGQALFVGLINNGYVFASELYGIVEESSRFVKLEGDKERIPGDLSTQGQIFVLDQSGGGGLENIKAVYFDGVEVDPGEGMLKSAEITTRDINRGDYSHFLLKEISESPVSVMKTLRGKFEIKEEPAGSVALFNIGKDIIPDIVVSKLKKGDIKKIYVIGQGTASIAGNGIAAYMMRVLSGTHIQIISNKATELSGFYLEDDMSHVLAIAVSQSGTTTDTNRTVDLLRSRGAHVVAIVNRRNSDLVYKSDGVFYTSDGRDIEMSVASTKAFYSQVVSGSVISLYFAQLLSALPPREIVKELRELMALPDKMHLILNNKEDVGKVAREFAVTRKYWAVVGSGPNKVAADEIRIKLSELCYKSIATDTTEDKKHIDLSSEPLIIICVAGVRGSNLQDMVKEVAIFKAHKACPIVIATDENEVLFRPYARGILKAPEASEATSMLLNTMVGHLWGYYAARSIDDSAAILKEARRFTVEALTESTGVKLSRHRIIMKSLARSLHPVIQKFYSSLRRGYYNSCLEVNNASQLSLLFKFVQGRIPFEDFEFDFGKEGNLNNVLNETVRCLSCSIADLTRPVDAIKHQAKTVTVGISRLEEVPEGILFDRLKEENISLSGISYQNSFILQSIGMAVEGIAGCTRYEVKCLDSLGSPSDRTEIHTISKTGISASMSSRADRGALLIGRKRSVVDRNRIFAGKGSSDGKNIVIVPLMEKGICREVILFQVKFKEELELKSRIELLKALDKYEDIKYVVTEMNIAWDDSLLNKVPVSDLISEDPDDVARFIAGAGAGAGR